MERGEVAILTGQFGALLIAILLLSSFVGASALSTPKISNVYWGAPTSGISLSEGTNNIVASNATTISVFYTLAPSTTPGSAAASRLCLDSNDVGQVFNYENITLLLDQVNHRNYLSFGPVGQAPGQTCTYTVTFTDSLQQVATWTATIQVKSK